MSLCSKSSTLTWPAPQQTFPCPFIQLSHLWEGNSLWIDFFFFFSDWIRTELASGWSSLPGGEFMTSMVFNGCLFKMLDSGLAACWLVCRLCECVCLGDVFLCMWVWERDRMRGGGHPVVFEGNQSLFYWMFQHECSFTQSMLFVHVLENNQGISISFTSEISLLFSCLVILKFLNGTKWWMTVTGFCHVLFYKQW